MTDAHQPQERADASAVFADFLQRKEEGGTLDFEAVCGEHPDLAEELRDMMELYDRLQKTPESGSESDPLRGERQQDLRQLYEGYEEERRGR